MIRLDHHTSPLSPNPKQSPEHKIIPWDDAAFAVSMDDIAHDSTGNGIPQPPDPASLLSPIDGNSTSPTGERSSSLSPVPPLAEEKEAEVEIIQREEEEEDEAAPAEQPSPPRVDKPEESRQSTPLSELSPPPDQDEDEGVGPTEATENKAEVETPEKPPPPEVDQTATEQIPSPSTAQPEPATQPPPSTSPAASIDTPAPMTPTIATATPSSNTIQDPKVVTILELNVELLKWVWLLFA